MTARTEGQAAIEAALGAFNESLRKDFRKTPAMRAAIAAYLAALAGWRLVPSGMVRDTRWHLAPPAPGLEQETD